MHRVFWQETISVAAGDVIVVDRHKCFQLSNLVGSVEIRLSNLSMLLPMLSSMSASMTAFLTASFILFWASSTTACSCSWLTHSLKSLGLLSPVCSPPAIENTKTGTNRWKLSLPNDYVVAVVSLFTASGSVLPSSYKVLTNTSSGWYNRQLVRDTCEAVVPRL